MKQEITEKTPEKNKLDQKELKTFHQKYKTKPEILERFVDGYRDAMKNEK